ncbi:MAG: leucine-rich repeat domain-containing protein, partial [archaeon]|nr:leucine-rich repeat domain-containing protein [archaeon]
MSNVRIVLPITNINMDNKLGDNISMLSEDEDSASENIKKKDYYRSNKGIHKDKKKTVKETQKRYSSKETDPELVLNNINFIKEEFPSLNDPSLYKFKIICFFIIGAMIYGLISLIYVFIERKIRQKEEDLLSGDFSDAQSISILVIPKDSLEILMESKNEIIVLSESFYGLKKENTKMYLNDNPIKFSKTIPKGTIIGPFKITFKFKHILKSFKEMFKNCKDIVEVKFDGVQTENVTSMEKTFKGCSSLKKVDFGIMNNTNLRDLDSMFEGCYNLKEVDFSEFNVKRINSMEHIFENCSSIETLNLTIFQMEHILNDIDFCNMNKLKRIISSKEIFEEIEGKYGGCVSQVENILPFISEKEKEDKRISDKGETQEEEEISDDSTDNINITFSEDNADDQQNSGPKETDEEGYSKGAANVDNKMNEINIDENSLEVYVNDGEFKPEFRKYLKRKANKDKEKEKKAKEEKIQKIKDKRNLRYNNKPENIIDLPANIIQKMQNGILSEETSEYLMESEGLKEGGNLRFIAIEDFGEEGDENQRNEKENNSNEKGEEE